jgi:hypothetical protein
MSGFPFTVRTWGLKMTWGMDFAETDVAGQANVKTSISGVFLTPPRCESIPQVEAVVALIINMLLLHITLTP